MWRESWQRRREFAGSVPVEIAVDCRPVREKEVAVVQLVVSAALSITLAQRPVG